MLAAQMLQCSGSVVTGDGTSLTVRDDVLLSQGIEGRSSVSHMTCESAWIVHPGANLSPGYITPGSSSLWFSGKPRCAATVSVHVVSSSSFAGHSPTAWVLEGAEPVGGSSATTQMVIAGPPGGKTRTDPI